MNKLPNNKLGKIISQHYKLHVSLVLAMIIPRLAAISDRNATQEQTHFLSSLLAQKHNIERKIKLALEPSCGLLSGSVCASRVSILFPLPAIVFL